MRLDRRPFLEESVFFTETNGVGRPTLCIATLKTFEIGFEYQFIADFTPDTVPVTERWEYPLTKRRNGAVPFFAADSPALGDEQDH